MSKQKPRTGQRTKTKSANVEVGSSELTRDINRDIILERVRALQPVSRVDLARASGLQPSTVSSIVEQLIEEGWIREGAVVRTARGRRPTMLSLDDNLMILVADVRLAHAVLAVVDLNGRFLSRMVVRLGPDVESSVHNIAGGLLQLREQHSGKRFEGIGLSVQGRVDSETNRLVLAPNLKWADYDISGKLSKQIGLRTELENDANACLLSELWFGHMHGVRDAALVTISEGVGAALFADGRLIGGRNGLAGEFGHVVVDPAGPLCGCGQHGCWEMFASSRAALRYYSELEPKAAKVTIEELISLAVSGSKSAKQALSRQAVAIGKGLRMLTASLSPEVILFAGDITGSWEMSKVIIERECGALMLAGAAPKLISIGDGELALLRGAAAVVLQRHAGYYRAPHRNRQRTPQATQKGVR